MESKLYERYLNVLDELGAAIKDNLFLINHVKSSDRRTEFLSEIIMAVSMLSQLDVGERMPFESKSSYKKAVEKMTAWLETKTDVLDTIEDQITNNCDPVIYEEEDEEDDDGDNITEG